MYGLQIATLALRAVKEKLPGFPRGPRQCLGFAVEVFARVINRNRWHVYTWVLDQTGVDFDQSRWAIDFEKGVDKLNWEVTKVDYNPRTPAGLKALMALLQPGDWVFSSRVGDEKPHSANTAPDLEGHIGIYVGSGLVAENTTARRAGFVYKNGNQVVAPLSSWNEVTMVARVPANWRPR